MTLYWLCLLPLLASVVVSLVYRHSNVAVGLGVAVVCTCLWLALGTTPGDGIIFLGQEWALDQAGRALLAFLYGTTAVLLIIASFSDQAGWFSAPALASTGLLSASVLLRSLLHSFLLLPAAMLVMVLTVRGSSRPAVRGASRFVAWIALPTLCVPAMSALLERLALSPGPTTLAQWSAWLSLPPIILWLNLFPSLGAMHLWSRESLGLGPVFLWVAKDMVVVYLLLGLWRQYPALRNYEASQVLGVAAFLTTVYSGVLAVAQSGPAAVLACAAMSELGVVLQGLAAGSANAVWGGLFLLVSRSVAILLVSSAVAAMPHVIVRESESGTRPYRWRSMLLLTAFAVGVVAMSGVPPLGSFAARGRIYAALQMTHPFVAWAWVLASAGIALGVIRTGWSLWHTQAKPPAASLRYLPLLPVIGLLCLCLWIELYPQRVLALLSESYRSLLQLFSIPAISSCLRVVGLL